MCSLYFSDSAHPPFLCVQYNSISQFLWAVFLMLCSPAPDISSVRLAFLSLARRVLFRITGKLVLLLILNYLYSCKPVVVRTLQRHCCIVKFKRLLPNTTLAELSLLSNINTSHSQFNEEWEEGSYKCCVSRDFSRFELPSVWGESGNGSHACFCSLQWKDKNLFVAVLAGF